MVLMIALVLVSILAIAVVPASAATIDVSSTDKAMMIVANKGTSEKGTAIVTWADPVALGSSAYFDLESGEDLQVKIGNNVLSVKDSSGKTYHTYKLDVSSTGATLSALSGSSYVTVSSVSATLSGSQTFGFTLDNTETLAKRAFVDNVVINGTTYNFNYTDKTDAKPGASEGETELSQVYGDEINVYGTGYSDAYIHQEEFKVSFANIRGGNVVSVVNVGYGKKVDAPAGYEVIDDLDKEKLALVECDLYIAVTEADNNLLGAVYLKLVNATFADGDYQGESFGIFTVGTAVNVVADGVPANATFHGWYKGEFDDVKDTPLSTETTYTYTVTDNTVLTVDYNLPTYDVYINGEVAFSQEIGDVAKVVAENRPGYIFQGFFTDEEMADLYTLDKSFNIVMDSDKYFFVKYEAIIYSITVISSGSVYLPDAPEGEQYVAGIDGIFGDEVTIVADEAPEGYHFVGWYAGAIKVADETKSTYTFNITGSMALSAKYEVKPVKITVVGGTIEGYESESSNPDEYCVTVSLGDEITLIPNFVEDYDFVGWKIGEDTELVLYKTYNYVTESNITIEAVFEGAEDPNAPVMVRVNNGTIKSNGSTSISVQKGTQVTVVANDPAENQTFLGWYNGNTELTKEKEYTFTVTNGVTYTAKFKTDSKPATGGCATIGSPNSGNGNGGMFMILGVLAIAALAVTFGRHGKKIVKHAPKALGIVLCLAILCGAVVIPEATAVVTEDGESLYTSNELTIEISDTHQAGAHEYVEYFPVTGFKLGDRVKVSMQIFLDRASENNQGWSLTTFKGFAGENIDDTLPVFTWTNLVYETRVISTNDGFAVALYMDVDGYFKATVKNVTIKPSIIETRLLGGATLYMLPNDNDVTNEQMNSFVLVTASGKVIVMDGGTHKDYVYLRDFLYSITSKVDAWFISHYHSDHIGALSIMLNQNDIYIDKLYYDFIDHEAFWGPIQDPSIEINEDFGFENYSEMYAKGLGSDGGNSGTLLNNKMQSVYSRKYGDGTGYGKGSWSYLLFYDEVNKHLARSESDPNRMIGEVIETKRGDVFTFDDVEYRVLNDVQIHGANFGNNTNINWRISTAGIDMLFLGDTGNEVGDSLMMDKEPIFDDNGDGVADSSVYQNLFGCTLIQAAHHGQNGVRSDFYEQILGDIYLYCAPYSLFYDVGELGIGTAPTQCEIEREWQRQMGTVSKTYWMNGLITIK